MGRVQKVADIMDRNDLGAGTENRRKERGRVQQVDSGTEQEHRQACVHPCQISSRLQGTLHGCARIRVCRPSVENCYAEIGSLDEFFQQERSVDACAGLVALRKAVVPGYLQLAVLHYLMARLLMAVADPRSPCACI